MATVDDMILRYELVQEPGQAGVEKIRRAREEVRRALEMEEPARRKDEIHPAWIVFGFALIALEYVWLFSVTG